MNGRKFPYYQIEQKNRFDADFIAIKMLFYKPEVP